MKVALFHYTCTTFPLDALSSLSRLFLCDIPLSTIISTPLVMNSMRCATLPTYLLRYSVYDYSSSNEANDMLRLVLFSCPALGLEARVMKNTAIRSTVIY